MTTQRSLSAAIQAQRERSAPNWSLQSQASGLEILIANPRLEFDVSRRKNTPVKISNRKKIAISHFTKRHRHSRLPRGAKGLCAFAKLRIRHIDAIASRAPESPQSPRLEFLIANGSRFCVCVHMGSHEKGGGLGCACRRCVRGTYKVAVRATRITGDSLLTFPACSPLP